VTGLKDIQENNYIQHFILKKIETEDNLPKKPYMVHIYIYIYIYKYLFISIILNN